jgi:hypothetical protein
MCNGNINNNMSDPSETNASIRNDIARLNIVDNNSHTDCNNDKNIVVVDTTSCPHSKIKSGTTGIPSVGNVIKQIKEMELKYTIKMKQLELEKDCLLLAHVCYCQYLQTMDLFITIHPPNVFESKSSYGCNFDGTIAYGFTEKLFIVEQQQQQQQHQKQSSNTFSFGTLSTPSPKTKTTARLIKSSSSAQQRQRQPRLSTSMANGNTKRSVISLATVTNTSTPTVPSSSSTTKPERQMYSIEVLREGLVSKTSTPSSTSSPPMIPTLSSLSSNNVVGSTGGSCLAVEEVVGEENSTNNSNQNDNNDNNNNNNSIENKTVPVIPLLPTNPLPKDIFEIAKAMAIHYKSVTTTTTTKQDNENAAAAITARTVDAVTCITTTTNSNNDPILQIFNQHLYDYGLQLLSIQLVDNSSNITTSTAPAATTTTNSVVCIELTNV